MRSASRFALLALTLPLGSGACARAAVAPSSTGGPLAPGSAPAAIAPSPPGAAPTLVYKVTPSRLVPEVSTSRGLVAAEDGARRMLVDRMRLLVRPDGGVDRALELMPLGNVTSVALPSRLGGGYLFHVNQGRGTEMWRAAGWLDKLTPLAHIGEVVTDVVPGFDRLYVRLSTGNRLLAIDASDGRPMPLGPLPSASSYGLLAFADGWRAVVDTDMRGPLATFDAGATWRSIPVRERVQAVGVVDGNPTIMVAGGRYVVDARGVVTFRSDAIDPRDPRDRAVDDVVHDDAPERRAVSPLGKRPLRAAVEDGWPESTSTALVARAGALARVSLPDGRVLAVAEDAYPEHRSTCHAARLGLHDVGFICGEADGPSTVYALAPPLGMRPVLRFEKPRTIAASGNGALVIRGRCAEDARVTERVGRSDVEDTQGHWYCVRTPTGDMREVRVKGFDLGVERVVGLGDGRIAVIVPPRGGSAGSLSVIGGGNAPGTTSSVPLTLPSAGRGHDLTRGLWLDGFEERRPGVLGGWVEAGGPYVGIEIGLDGKVTAGEPRDELGAVFGGRFAVALLENGRALETTDGGMSWAPFDLPDRDEEARAAPSRGCGPVGCSLPGWVRVGWGEPRDADDMQEARSPTAAPPPLRVSPTLTLACSVISTSTPPLPERPAASAPPVLAPSIIGRFPSYSPPPAPAARSRGPSHDTGWSPFRNLEAPRLGQDDYGVDNGTGPNDTVGLRAYAWGKSGADWTRGGRWMVRFDDRFDPAGGVRATAITASLWAQQTDAVDGIGTQPYTGTRWGGFLDPSGHALLASACSNRLGCAIYAIAEGQPILPLRSQSNFPPMRPYDGGAVRVGEAWYFLAMTPSYDGVALWKGELGSARQLATYHRTIRGYGTYAQPKLVRRAMGQGIGVLLEGPAEPGERSGSGSWFVLPVDPDTGALGDAIPLVRRDFHGVTLARCAPGEDGWAFDAAPGTDLNTNVELDNARARFDAVELRLRVDPGRACVEGLAAKSDSFFALATGPAAGSLKLLTAAPGRKATGADEGGLVPMAATDRSTGRRWGLACKLKR